MNIETPSRPRLALIAGPTASGKSAMALALAERENGVIVNADASQVYRELRILSARPDRAEEARAPHRLYGYRDGALSFSATQWAENARLAITEAHAQGRLPILVGGTGLYLRVLLDGIAPVPEIDADVRREVRSLDAAKACAALTQEDPEMAERLHAHDTTRLQRALEVIRSTGRSLADWQSCRAGGIRDTVELSVTIVDPAVVELYARCDLRVDGMLDRGAVDEVRALLDRKLDPDLPVMRAIGVSPLASYLRGQLSLDAATAQVKQATRNYAKRQRTWFRHQQLCPS